MDHQIRRYLPTGLALFTALAAISPAYSEIHHRTKFTFNGTDSGDGFGHAIDASGTYLYVGAPYADAGGDTDTGKFYRYNLSTGNGTFLKRGVDAYDHFGFSVAIGNKRFVGAPGAGSGGDVYVYDNVTGTYPSIGWSGHSSGKRGFAIAASNDKIFVGTPYHGSYPDNNEGAAHLYTVSILNGTPITDAKLSFYGGEEDYFAGYDISTLGANQVAVGIPKTSTTETGTVKIISNSAPFHTLETIDGDDAGESFGFAVSDGGSYRVLIGAPDNDDAATNAGKAYLYTTSGTLMTTFAGGSAGDAFGDSLGLAGDIDDDGIDDLMIASTSTGNVHIYSGNDYSLLWSQSSSSGYGTSMTGIGDVNGDGIDDFAIGDPTGGTNSGGYVEIYFSQLVGDTDVDGDIDSTDIDYLFDSLSDTLQTGFDPRDLNEDDVIDQEDVDELVEVVIGTYYGDTDLDGDVDDADLGTIFNNYGSTSALWATGDTDGDGDVDGADTGTAFANYTGPLSSASVPEPSSLALLLSGALLFRRRPGE